MFHPEYQEHAYNMSIWSSITLILLAIYDTREKTDRVDPRKEEKLPREHIPERAV